MERSKSDRGRTVRKEAVSTQSNKFNDAPVSSCSKHTGAATTPFQQWPHKTHTHRQTHKHTDRSPANRNSISLLFLCLLFISWIPREASKAALSVSPLTVLCVCHSSLVKIKSHNHTRTHTHTLTPPSPSWEFPVVKLFHLDGNFFFCHYPL